MAETDGALLWGRRPRPSRGRRPGLSLDRIVAEAVAIADVDGLEGLSMKRLAARLDSGVMSLYRHVPGKDELLELMLEAAVGTPPTIKDPQDWRRGLYDWSMAFRDVLHAHPWSGPLFVSDRTVGPNETDWLEAELQALSSLNLAPAKALNTALAVSSYVRGAALAEISSNGPRFGLLDYPDEYDRYPHVTAVITAPDNFAGAGVSDFFEFGLKRVLNGIAPS
ncbi:MAG: TetR/AcrR family transcriptional regulator [Stackebrandtia sp.]